MQQDNMDNQAWKEAASFPTHSSITCKLWLLVQPFPSYILQLSKKTFLPIVEKEQPYCAFR